MPLADRSAVGQRTLDNGLQVVWEEDHRQPLVAIEAHIKGGLRGEGAYLGTGITHAIEHMLFKGTTSRKPGTIDQEVRSYGGTINAFTSLDMTGVSLFVESRSLPKALAMLADILQHAVFDAAEFEKERAVIISEIQMNLDDPDRRLHQLFWSRHFLKHPYRHPILGYQPLLERLTVNDLAALYAAQYQPQNIVLSCVGDLDPAALTQLVKDTFGAWARGRLDPTQQVVPQEPPAASAKTASVELPVNVAYVTLGFSSTRLTDPDLYPLDVLASILGRGKSSQLYETLIHQRRLAHTISAWNYTPDDPGVFGIAFTTDSQKVPQAIHAVTEVIDAIRRGGVSETELEKAKRQVVAEYLLGLQTMESRASDLAGSLASTGDPLFSRAYVERIGSVSAADVQAAARRYCDSSKMTTAIVRPPAPPAANAAPARAGQPSMAKRVLPSGAVAIVGADHTLPLAAIMIGFHGGVRVETDDTQGLSNLVATMLTKGTSRRSASQLAEQVEAMGGNLTAFSGRDEFGLVLQVLAEDLDAGLALAHELVTDSTFPEEELAIQRELIVKRLETQQDEIFQVGADLLRTTLFPHHPYRFNPLGSEANVPRLTRQQCMAFAKQWAAPSNAVIGVYGDLDPQALNRQIERFFGTRGPSVSSWPASMGEDALENVREASKTVEKEQALILMGFRSTTHVAADTYPLEVLTAVLSGMAGRLFQSVRERQGLSYTLGAANVPGWDPGYLLVYAATRPNEQGQVLTTVQDQLTLLVEHGVTEEEVEQAKRYLIGLHRADLQELASLLKEAVADELHGLGYDAWTAYEQRISAVTPAMVNEVARRYVTLGRRAQVVVAPSHNGRAP